MLTLKQVNKAIHDAGIDAVLHKASDHYYLEGSDVDYAYSANIGVYRLNHLTLERWVEKAKEIKEDSQKNDPAYLVDSGYSVRQS